MCHVPITFGAVNHARLPHTLQKVLRPYKPPFCLQRRSCPSFRGHRRPLLWRVSLHSLPPRSTHHPMTSSKRICAYHLNAVHRTVHQSDVSHSGVLAQQVSHPVKIHRKQVQRTSGRPPFPPLAYPVNSDGSQLFWL